MSTESGPKKRVNVNAWGNSLRALAFLAVFALAVAGPKKYWETETQANALVLAISIGGVPTAVFGGGTDEDSDLLTHDVELKFMGVELAMHYRSKNATADENKLTSKE